MIARQPRQRFRLQLDSAGVRVELDRAPRSSFDVSFAELGCPTQMAALERGGEPILGEGHNRVEVERSASLTEWYVNGPLGVEQGLTLTKLPGCLTGGGVLVVRGVKNAGWRVEARDHELAAVGPGGATFHYGSVAAFDANDRELPARATTDGERLILEVTVRDAALPIMIDPLIWVKDASQVLRPANGAAHDAFGSQVVLNEDSLLVGAFGRNASAGEAYAYFLDGASWGAEQALAPDGLAADEWFGYALASDGMVALATAPLQGGTGAAYLYQRDGSAWQTPPTPLVPTTALAADDFFGGAVALSGDTLLVGALYGGKVGVPDAGLVYVFERAAGVWNHVGELEQPQADRADFTAFGTAIALRGDVAVVGAPDTPTGGDPGAAYVFHRTNGVWDAGARLDPQTTDAFGFGFSAALADGVIAVGAPSFAKNTGRVFIFEKSEQWEKTRDFEGSEEQGGFATAVALSDEALVVGEPFGVGLVYPYVRDEGGWQSRPELARPVGDNDDQFGASLSLLGPRLLIGAVNARGGALAGPGSAHLRLLDTGSDCESGADCDSGHCSRNLCCNAACTETCYSCNGTETGEAYGTCARVLANTDPNGDCDGSSCTSPVIATTSLCDGAGACQDTPVSCGNFRCEGSACLELCENDGDCAETGFCAGARCEAKRPKGAACDASNQCDSEFCTDGFCCDRSCDGQCEACNEPGSIGECVPIEGEPRGERPACAAAAKGTPCRQAACDGIQTDSCLRFKGQETVCQPATCEAGELTPAARCDGQGECTPSLSIPCGDYACGAVACLDSCTTDADCAFERYCNNGSCGSTRSCIDDNHDADNTDCGDFVCRRGECLSECKSQQDCADGLTCYAGACQVFRSEAGSASCSAATSAVAHNHWHLTGLALALVFARLRRRSTVGSNSNT